MPPWRLRGRHSRSLELALREVQALSPFEMATLDLVELGLTLGVAVGAEILVPPPLHYDACVGMQRRSCHPSLLTGPRGAMRLQSAPGVRVQPGQDGGPRDARCRIAPAPARIGTFTEPKVLQRRAPLRISAATGIHTATELACRAPRADPGSRPDVGRRHHRSLAS